jgi:hypothetical protein
MCNLRQNFLCKSCANLPRVQTLCKTQVGRESVQTLCKRLGLVLSDKGQGCLAIGLAPPDAPTVKGAGNSAVVVRLAAR